MKSGAKGVIAQGVVANWDAVLHFEPGPHETGPDGDLAGPHLGYLRKSMESVDGGWSEPVSTPYLNWQ